MDQRILHTIFSFHYKFLLYFVFWSLWFICLDSKNIALTRSTGTKLIKYLISCMEKHTWYLDSALVPLALFDDEVPATEKIAIATKLLGSKMYYSNFGREHVRVSSILEISYQVWAIWLTSILTSCLIILVSLKLNLKIEDLFKLPVEYWKTQSTYKTFEKLTFKM